MKSIKNKHLALLVTLAMILSMALIPVFAVQQSQGMDEPVQVSEDDTIIELHSSHIGTYSEDFNNEPEENGGLEDPVVWHFVLNQLNRGQEPLMIEAEFEDAGMITVEGRPVGNGSMQHFFIGTEYHDTLINASVVIPGESGGRLVLSHVAFGDVEEPADDEEDDIDGDDDEIDEDVDDEDENDVDDEIDVDDEDENDVDEENDVDDDDVDEDESDEVLGDTEEEDETVVEEETVTITDDETPQGTVEEESSEEESDDEEVIILDEETPLGTDVLPQTGDGNPIIFVLSGLMLTAIGIGLKRFAL